ncbi:MAG: hypothetical protein IT260_02210 [Saprospiraceae bacterium]|nr:hypothetical protein [Saprospiraceae bacterium]
MEDKSSTNTPFEKLMRQQLKQLDATPEPDTWAQIAAQQSGPNKWLRLRHYAKIGLPIAALCLLALGGWWYQRSTGTPPVAPANTTPALESATPPPPVAEQATPGEGFLPGANPAAGPGEAQIYPPPVAANRRWGNQLNTVPAATVQFQAEAGLDYRSPVSGTSVQIPGGALVHADGRPVRGKVDLLFREYRNIPDFLASGIPMHYGDQRGNYSFNSGGMFEVRVSQNGEQLQMGPGQQYDVAFVPTSQLAKASLYYLDDATGNWSYVPDAAFASGENGLPSALPPVASEAEVTQGNSGRDLANCLPDVPFLPVNADVVEWVKQSVQAGYDLATEKYKMPKWFRKVPWMNNEQLLNSLERSKIRIVRDRDRMEQFFPEDINNVFTELKAFKGCYFMRSVDSTNNPQVTDQLSSEDYWQRMSIFKDKGNTVHITLYSEKGMIEFYADLTASAGNSSFNVDKVLAEYHRLRTERQNNFEALVTNLRRFLWLAPAFQGQDEWCMETAVWLDWFEANHPQMRRRYEALVKAGVSSNDSIAQATWTAWRSRIRNQHLDRYDRPGSVLRNTKNSMVYALQVSSFGVYNCDQIYRLSSGYIYAAYQTADGRRVVPATVSVMERNARMFFTLPSTERLLSAPGRQIDVVVTDREGRNYHIPGERYARFINTRDPKANSNTFVVDDITEKTRTPRGWAEYLDM